MGMVTMDNVETVFRSVPVNEGQKKTIGLMEEKFVQMAKDIIFNVPDSADRSAALRDLRHVKMVCTDAIAKGGMI